MAQLRVTDVTRSSSDPSMAGSGAGLEYRGGTPALGMWSRLTSADPTVAPRRREVLRAFGVTRAATSPDETGTDGSMTYRGGTPALGLWNRTAALFSLPVSRQPFGVFLIRVPGRKRVTR